jgi:hypothetical protein
VRFAEILKNALTTKESRRVVRAITAASGIALGISWQQPDRQNQEHKEYKR